ncbi:XdhC family protein [Cohnella suwonensis]|uniref:XdhC family protein n=1 Tax=Cohnella suwonensis TaxID=696072 RepID=A0ABW0M539_9BACL
MDGYNVLSYAFRVGKPAVLATIVETEGHSYRKPGASMLLLPDGGTIGSLSPGCLEADLSARAGELLETGEAEIVAYDLRPEQDVVWGDAIGCGGIIRIVLEPLGAARLEALTRVYEEVEAGTTVEWLRYPAGKSFDDGFRLLSSDSRPSARERTGRKEPSGPRRDAVRETGRSPLFSTLFRPRPRLFVFGADDGTVPIARLAALSGFRVAIGDWRRSLCEERRFPGAGFAVGTAEEIAGELKLASSDYVLICGHQLRKDREMLEKLLPLKPPFVGIMGSRGRVGQLLDGLDGAEGIHAPVGLDIGADGPEEIAVSVVAQLIQTRNARTKLRGESAIAYRGHLFGGGAKQQNVGAEAYLGACAR